MVYVVGSRKYVVGTVVGTVVGIVGSTVGSIGI